MTPEQEAEAIQIELELRRRKRSGEQPEATETGAAIPEEEASAATNEEPRRRTITDLLELPGKIASKMDREAQGIKERGWENLSVGERFDLLVLGAPKFIKREVVGPAEGLAERAVPPAAGQFLGRITRIPGADRVLGAIGGAGGELLAAKREGRDATAGQLLEAAISGGTTMKPLAGAGVRETATEALKLAGAGLVGEVAEKGIDESRLPTAGEAALATGASAVGAPAARALSVDLQSLRRRAPLYELQEETLKKLRSEGVVIPPHEIDAGSDILASVGGKAALQQEAAKRNQPIWQKLAREEVGLSKEAVPIRLSELKVVRDEFAAPYREIQTIQREAKQQLEERLRVIARESDPHAAAMALEEPAMKESLSILNTLAAADVDALKAARHQMQRSRRAFFNGDPNAYEPWQKAKADAEAIEDAIERAAASLKDETLLGRLKESRKRIAQTYAVEESVNPGNGFVDPVVFGRQVLEDPRSLTGKLADIGNFQLAFRREAVEASRVPSPNVGNIGTQFSATMASRGDAPGAIGAIFNATAGRPARAFLLSDLMQDMALSPIERQNLSAAMARYVAENAAETQLEESEATTRGP